MKTVEREKCAHLAACPHGNCRGCEPCGDCAMERQGEQVFLWPGPQRGTVSMVRFDDRGKPIYHVTMANNTLMLARDEELSSAHRDDFYWDTETAEEREMLAVSKSEEFGGSCLIQVGTPGEFSVAYLTDEQALALSRALDRYLKAS